MTIATSSNKVVAQGNGATTLFSFNFLIPISGDELVIYTDALGNQTTLTNTQYTLTGFGVPAGGTVLYPISGSPIAPGTSLTIARILPLIQTTSISNQGAFYPNAVEAGLDYSMMAIQQISQQQAQGVFAPIVDTITLNPLPAAAQRANQLLGFDGTGQPIAAQPSSALVSTVMQPVVSAGSIATAVAALGIPVFVGVGTTSGSANAQVMAATVPGTYALTVGNKLTFIPAFTNTSAMTLQVGLLPVKNVFKRAIAGPIALAGGEVVAGQITNVIYDGTQYILEEQGILTNPTIYLKQSGAPTPTVNGDLQWDTTNKRAVVGNGAGQTYFASDPVTTVANTVPRYSNTTGARTTSNVTIDNSDKLTAPGGLAGASGTIPFQKLFESSGQTITSGGGLTLAHGLSSKPKLYFACIVCLTAELGYSIGDEVAINPGTQDVGSNRGISIVPDATNMNIRMGSSPGSAFAIMAKNTGGWSPVTNANWNLVIRAWA